MIKGAVEDQHAQECTDSQALKMSRINPQREIKQYGQTIEQGCFFQKATQVSQSTILR